jgi:hypothetical protein
VGNGRWGSPSFQANPIAEEHQWFTGNIEIILTIDERKIISIFLDFTGTWQKIRTWIWRWRVLQTNLRCCFA